MLPVEVHVDHVVSGLFCCPLYIHIVTQYLNSQQCNLLTVISACSSARLLLPV